MLLAGAQAAGAARADNGALPKACTRLAETGPLLPYRDPEGRFELARPCGWSQVTTLVPGSSVLASFYNPEEPGAETLAVYRSPAPEGVRETGDLGSAQDFAQSLARIAPNGLVMEAHAINTGGRTYIVAHVQFGGNTTGMFGSAREFRAVTAAEGTLFTLRVTTTRYRYLADQKVRQWITGVADSFRLLP